MLLGNEKGKKLVGYYFLSSIITAILSILLFTLLGTFYKASDNKVLVNALVWVTTILISFCLFYFPYYVIRKISKKNHGPLLNGYAIVSGTLSILLYCLGNSYSLDDYSYTEVLGYFAGIIALIQISIDIAKGNKKEM